jgi:hypothetical protein
MTWLRFFAKVDDEFACVLYQQIVEFAGTGVQFVEELNQFDGILFVGESRQQMIWDSQSNKLLSSRQILTTSVAIMLRGIEGLNFAGTLENSVDGLKERGLGMFWGLRWQLFLMSGRPWPLGPFASHEHSPLRERRDESYAATIYDYCCVLRGTRWFCPTTETEEERCIETLPYLTLVGIFEAARRSIGEVVEQGETFEQLPATSPRPTRLVEDAVRAAAALIKLLANPAGMLPHQIARLHARYSTETLRDMIDDFQRRGAADNK